MRTWIHAALILGPSALASIAIYACGSYKTPKDETAATAIVWTTAAAVPVVETNECEDEACASKDEQPGECAQTDPPDEPVDDQNLDNP